MARPAEIPADLGNDYLQGPHRPRLVFRDRLVSDLPGSQRHFASRWSDRGVDSVSCSRPREFLWRRRFRVSDSARLVRGSGAKTAGYFWRNWWDAVDSHLLSDES